MMRRVIAILMMLGLALPCVAETDLTDAINLLTDGSFRSDTNRTVKAYNVRYNGTTEAASGGLTRRTMALPVTNVPTVEIRTTAEALAGGGDTGQVIIPVCATSTLLYGMNATTEDLYSSPDGDTWTLVNADVDVMAVGAGSPVFALSNGTLLYVKVADNTIYISTNGGTSFSKAANTAGGDATLSGAKVGFWDLAENGSGGVVLGTYLDTATENQLWYSADYGATWTKGQFTGVTYGTATDLPIGWINHFHSICWHPGTSKWIANTGDGAGRRQDWLSSDGLTWSPHVSEEGTPLHSGTAQAGGSTTTIKLAADASATSSFYVEDQIRITSGACNGQIRRISAYNGSTKIATVTAAFTEAPDAMTYRVDRGFRAPDYQVTRYRDYGDAARLICGMDSISRLCYLNLSTWQVETVCPERIWWEEAAGADPIYDGEVANNVFDLRQIGGIWYAATSSGGASGARRAAIMVSADRTRWLPYYQVADATYIGFLNILGSYGGNLHAVLARTDASDWTTYAHVVISAAKISNKTGLILTPTSTNMLASAIAECSSTGWTTTFDTEEVVTSGQLQGTNCVHGVSADVNYLSTKPIIATLSGMVHDTYYQGRCWIKGKGEFATIAITCSNDAGNAHTTQNRRFAISPDVWTELVTECFTGCDEGGGQVQSLRIEVTSPPYDEAVEVWWDAASVVPVIGNISWHPGQEASDAEWLDYTASLGTDWTHVFTVIMPAGSDNIEGITTVQPLVTYKVDADDYVTLGYDGDDHKFSLAATDAGAPGDSALSSALFFHRGTMVKFIVRSSGGELRMSYGMNGAVEHVAALVTKAELATAASRHIFTGAVDGSGVMPHILVESKLYNVAMSDTLVNEMLTKAAWETWSRKAGGGLFITW